MSDLQTAIDAYSELERKIDRAWAGLSGEVCGRCTSVCCRPDICREAVESDWLRLVSEQSHGRWIPADVESRLDGECVALREDGCLLTVGRPPVCRGYYCPAVLDACGDVFEVIFYAFSAEIPWMVGKLGRGGDLVTLGEDRLEAAAGRILRAVERAEATFELARELLSDAVSPERKHGIVLALICESGAFLKQEVKDRILRELAEQGLALPQPPS